MSKKLFIRLVVPLLAIAAFATMTAASAQACVLPAGVTAGSGCHYTNVAIPKAGSPMIAAGTQHATLSWGTLTLKTEGVGSVTCQNALLGDVENPKPSEEEENKGENNKPGRGETEGWATADCFAAGCENQTFVEMDVVFEELPYANELVEREPGVVGVHTLGPSNGLYGIKSENKLDNADAGKGLTPGATGGEAWLTGTEEAPFEAATAPSKISSPIGAEVTTKCEFRPHVADIATKTPGFEASQTDKLFTPGDWDSIPVPGAPITQCYGESTPRSVNGNGKPGQNPGRVEFDQPKTGLLKCVGIAGEGETTGHLLVMDYENKNLINTF
jgi:hypothetical protein